jgi:transposase
MPAASIIPFPSQAIQRAMPANLLNLRDYEVMRLDENDHDYHVWAELKLPPAACVYCQSDNLVGFGRRKQLVKDLPMQGKRVGLYINARRMQCQACDRTFTEPLPAVDEKRAMTTRLLAWIGKHSVSRTFASIAEEVGIVEGTVRSIFRDHVNDLERTIRFETPKWMGIDEIHLIRPRCVISNIRNNTIVNLLPNRDKKTVAKYLTGLPDRQEVLTVAMDMWTPYRDAVRAVLPQARIVIDKFHVVRMANDALERVRKALRADLTISQRRGLMHDRFVLLKRQRDLSEQERLTLDG